jgi:DNA-directed RNA polymerase specialized sigma24 family protein
MILFEDKIEIINSEIARRKGKWMLTSLAYIDYDDVSQLLRIHINTKWGLWDQTRPLEQWLNTVITHKMINLVRDHYGRVAPPCNGCPHNLAEDSCSFTKSGSKCGECPLYKKWQTKTQAGYNIKLASSINSETFVEPVSSSVSFSDYIDYDVSSSRLHVEMKKILPENQYKIYDLLVIQNLSDKEVAKRLRLRSSEKGRPPGYKYLYELRNKFYELAKKIIEEKDIL